MKKLFLLFFIFFLAINCYGMDHDDYELFTRTNSPNYQVTKLRIVNHPELRTLKQLQHFPNLKRFSIQDCPNVKGLERSLTSYGMSLRRLTLCRMGLVNLSFLTAFSGLESLNLTANYDITSISPLLTLSRLRILHLMSCTSIKDISPLSDMTKLKRLGLASVLIQYPPRNPSLPQSIHFLEPLASSLEYLDLSCNDLLTLSPLEKFHKLRFLDLNGSCDNGKKWEGLESLKNLQYLNLGNAQYRMKSFKFLETLPNLKRVYVQEEELIPKFKKRSGLRIGSHIHMYKSRYMI